MTHSHREPAPTGILSGDGATLVRALVYHHPTPEVVPAAFTGVVEPVRDVDSAIHDWRLCLRKLVASGDTQAHDIWATFSAWRRSYVTERYVGDVATMRAFLHWAEPLCEVESLGRMVLPKTRIDSKTALHAAWELHEAATACRERGEEGLGVSVPQRARLARGFVLGDEPLLVLADGGATLHADASGFRLADPSLPSMVVHGWRTEGGEVTALTDDGSVPLDSSAGSHLLVEVAPGAAEASVQQVPLTDVFDGLFTNLRQMAKLAAADHAPLFIRRGSPTD